MKKTINIDETVYKRIKREAERKNLTIGNFISLMFTNYYKERQPVIERRLNNE